MACHFCSLFPCMWTEKNFRTKIRQDKSFVHSNLRPDSITAGRMRYFLIEYMCAWQWFKTLMPRIFAFWVRQDLGKSLCAWLYPRAQPVCVAIAMSTIHWFSFIILCAWLSHAHVRVAKSRARILYTKPQPGLRSIGLLVPEVYKVFPTGGQICPPPPD